MGGRERGDGNYKGSTREKELKKGWRRRKKTKNGKRGERRRKKGLPFEMIVCL